MVAIQVNLGSITSTYIFSLTKVECNGFICRNEAKCFVNIFYKGLCENYWFMWKLKWYYAMQKVKVYVERIWESINVKRWLYIKCKTGESLNTLWE